MASCTERDNFPLNFQNFLMNTNRLEALYRFILLYQVRVKAPMTKDLTCCVVRGCTG